MTLTDPAAALARLDFSPRHAAFLAQVLRVSGYFLRRQVVAASGCGDGRVTTKFLRRLVSRGLASRATYARRTRLYHVRHPYLYEVVGHGESSFRRRATPSAIVRRLMALDTLLAYPEARVLATSEEMTAYFAGERHVQEGRFPVRWSRQGRRGPLVRQLFPDRAPVLVDPADGRVSVAYVQGPASSLAGWGTFLDAYGPLLSDLPRARVVFATVDPEGFRTRVTAAFARWQTNPYVSERARQLARRRALRRYFELRKEADWLGPWHVSAGLRKALENARRPFDEPRYEHAYTRWREEGEALLCRITACTTNVSVGHVEFVVHWIPHRYDCFGTLVAQSLHAKIPTGRRHPRRIDSARSRAPLGAGTGKVGD